MKKEKKRKKKKKKKNRLQSAPRTYQREPNDGVVATHYLLLSWVPYFRNCYTGGTAEGSLDNQEGKEASTR